MQEHFSIQIVRTLCSETLSNHNQIRSFEAIRLGQIPERMPPPDQADVVKTAVVNDYRRAHCHSVSALMA